MRVTAISISSWSSGLRRALSLRHGSDTQACNLNREQEQDRIMNKMGWGLLLVMVWLTGCNTINGMGRDIQKGGEKVQEAATSVQKKI